MEDFSKQLRQLGLDNARLFRLDNAIGGRMSIEVSLDEVIEHNGSWADSLYNDLRKKILNSPEISDLKRSYENKIKDMENRNKEQEEAIMKLSDAIYQISNAQFNPHFNSECISMKNICKNFIYKFLSAGLVLWAWYGIYIAFSNPKMTATEVFLKMIGQ